MNEERKIKWKLSRTMLYIGSIVGVWTSYALPSIKSKIGFTILAFLLIFANKLIDMEK